MKVHEIKSSEAFDAPAISEEELLILRMSLAVVKQEDFKGSKVEVRHCNDGGLNVDIVAADGVRWLLWNPPNCAGYVLMREDEL